MALTFAHGSDGSVTMPSGDFNASINTWSCSMTRSTAIVTGFGDTGQRRRASAVLDITGSAGGIMKYGAASTKPTGITGSSGSAEIVLKVQASSSLTFNAIINSTDMSVTQDGESTVSFNFEMDDSDGPTVAWVTS